MKTLKPPATKTLTEVSFRVEAPNGTGTHRSYWPYPTQPQASYFLVRTCIDDVGSTGVLYKQVNSRDALQNPSTPTAPKPDRARRRPGCGAGKPTEWRPRGAFHWTGGLEGLGPTQTSFYGLQQKSLGFAVWSVGVNTCSSYNPTPAANAKFGMICNETCILRI